MLDFLFSDPKRLVSLLAGLFFAVLFLQSGLDKVFQWQGNLSWLKGHFSKTFLRSFVPLLLGIITLAETAAGGFSAIGTVLFLVEKSNLWPLQMGFFLSALSLLMLFFGQRVAQDYAGAATLTTYFLIALFAIFMTV
jgi:hypothetical protein